MVKSEIIKELHQKHPGLNRSQVEAIVETFFSTILENLEKDRSVELRDFGRFSVKTIKARYNARNPKTGETIYVPERKKVSFKMSKHLKQEINKEFK